MNTEKTYIIPDIHGRDFWHDIEKLDSWERIIFLGDYVDPYREEGFTPNDAITELKRVIEFARTHLNVTLLLGNHDAGYFFSDYICECRMDYDNYLEIQNIFRDNRDLFKLAYYDTIEIDGNTKDVVFTHAGLSKQWLKYLYGEYEMSIEDIVKDLNEKFDQLKEYFSTKTKFNDDVETFYQRLCLVSYNRGGWGYTSSCMWSDIRDYTAALNILPDVYQIVGHTRLGEKGAYVRINDIICIDSQVVWTLKDALETKIHLEIDTNEQKN